jgi:PAS domain S-box-containing protein
MTGNQLFSIAKQLRYGLVSIVVSSVLITGGSLTYLSFREQAEQTRQLQQERSQGAANKISAYLDNLQRQLNYLSELRGLTDFTPETQRNILEGLVNSNSAYELVGMLNNRGQVVQAMSPYEPVSPSQLNIALASANSPLFLRAFKDGQNYVSSVEIDSKLSLPVATLAVPIRNRQNQIQGVLFAKITLNFLTQITDRTQVGKTGYSYVLDNRLVLIAGGLTTAEHQNSNVKAKSQIVTLQDLKDRPFVRELFRLSLSPTIQPVIVYQGLNGEDVVGTATLVRRVQWIVVAELPTAEAYAPVRWMILVMGGATLVAVVVAVSLGIAFSNSITIPLKSLTTAASKISSGQFDSQVNIVASNELGELAKSFNSMAKQLQASFAEMKALNEELSKSEKRLTQFLEAMPVAVFVADASGKPYYANQTAQQILGKGIVANAANEELAEVYQAYLAGSEQLYPSDQDALLRALKGESATLDDMEIHQPHKIVPIEVWGTPIFDEEGKVAYAIAAFQDITKRKQAEQLLAKYNQTLERTVEERTQALSQALEHLKATQEELIQSEKMAALGQLIAGVAHEINTPLGAIRSSIKNIDDLLTNNLEKLPEFFQNLSPERQKYFLVLLSKSSYQTSSLSSKEKRQFKKDLKRQLESHSIENPDSIASTLVNIGVWDDIQPFLSLLKDPDSESILKTAYELATLQKSARTIATATERAAKVVFALKSYAHYDYSGEKVLANIIEGIETILTLYHNQLKQGVEVMKNYDEIPLIFCYPDELNQVWTNLVHNALQAMDYKGNLRIDVERQEPNVLVSITDSGKGIPAEIMPKIFEPFFTTKSAGEGSGLGLDIVKKIVEKHQGKIEFNSVSGKTTFTVVIPINS